MSWVVGRGRHPVSTLVGELGRGAVLGGVVGGMGLPGLPEDADPGAGEDADGVGVVAAALAGLGVDVCCPGRGVAGVVGEAGDRPAQTAVAGPAEDDPAALAGGVGDRADAGLGGELIVGREAFADVTQLGQDLGRAEASGAREGHDDAAVGQCGDPLLDRCGERLELAGEGREQAGEGAHQLTLGLALGLAGAAAGRLAQAAEQLGRGPPAAIGLPGKEPGEAFLAEAGGAFWGRVALQEGERDRRGQVGEDAGGARPETIEQGLQAVAERDPLADQVVATANQSLEGPDRIGGRGQGTEPVAVGAKNIGEHVGIARIALARRCPVAWPTGLDDVGMDRDDRMAGLDQSVDQQARGALDGDRDQLGRRQLGQPSPELGQALGSMRDHELIDQPTTVIDHSDRILPNPNLRTNPCPTPSSSVTMCRVGRPCGWLIDWRSWLANRGASPCSPSRTPGRRRAAGLPRADQRQAGMAVATATRKPQGGGDRHHPAIAKVPQ